MRITANIWTISELEMHLHNWMRESADPSEIAELLEAERRVARKKLDLEVRFPGRNVGALPFYLLFAGGR